MNPKIIKAIAVTAELTGTELSEAAIRVMASDLAAYPEQAALRALDRCRKELKGRMTLAAVLERVEGLDGRPGPEEAWSIALSSADEAETVVWTDEISQALAVADPLLAVRDKVAARMAFSEKYQSIVRESRERGIPCRWSVSIGHDPALRERALSAAVAAGRIGAAQAHALLPAYASPALAALVERDEAKLLANIPEDFRASAVRGLAMVRAELESLQAQGVEHD